MKLTSEVFWDIVDDIESLAIWADKIIITGSLALCSYGLKDEFDDVDIILVNPNKGSYCELLEKYNEEKDGYYLCRVKDKRIPIDILRNDYVLNNPLIEIKDGIYLSSIADLIHAKKELDREKDKKDFLEIENKLNSYLKMLQ